MAAKRRQRRGRGRPAEGRLRVKVLIRGEILKNIDSNINKEDEFLNSRGKVIESRFQQP